MFHKEQMNQRSNGRLTELVPKLIVNWLVPLILYMIMHNTFSNDTIALAVAGAMPAIWTIILWMWSHKVNWIGVIAVLGLFIAMAVSALSGGGSLPLKLYHPVISGAVGLILLVSVVIKKPLMIVLLKKFKVGDSERFSNPEINRKIAISTTLLGTVLLLNAIIHTFIALTLSTGAYLIISRIVTLVTIGTLFFASKLVVRRKC